MPILYLHDKIYDTIKEHELISFLKACDEKGLQYLQIDDASWQLLPQLKNKSFVVYSLVKEPGLKNFVRNFEAQLTRHGAAIVNESPHRVNLNVFTSSNIQICLVFTQNTILPEDSHLILYYSLRDKETTIRFIGGLAKHLKILTGSLTFNIATYWKHLTNFKYAKATYAGIPTAIIEFNNSKISELELTDLTSCLINNIIDLYGTKTVDAELKVLSECLIDAAAKKPNVSQDIKLNSAKVNTQTATRKKTRTKKFRGKLSSVIPSGTSSVNYFPRPGSAGSASIFSQSYSENNKYPRTIYKSTFNRNAPDIKDQMAEISRSNIIIPESKQFAEKKLKEKGSFQGFKELKKILDKDN